MLEITETKDFKLIASLNEDVQNLHCKLHPEIFKPYNRLEIETALAEFLKDEHCKSYLVTKDGTPISYAVFFIQEMKENAFHYAIRTLYIDQIGVLEQHRKCGAGSLLMEQAEKLSKQFSIHRIEISHWNSNIVAAAYFRAKGYKLFKERLYKIIA